MRKGRRSICKHVLLGRILRRQPSAAAACAAVQAMRAVLHRATRWVESCAADPYRQLVNTHAVRLDCQAWCLLAVSLALAAVRARDNQGARSAAIGCVRW